VYERIGKTIGDRIRYLREIHGISQGEIAKEFSLSDNSIISKYELNKRIPPMDVVVDYSTKFGVSTDWILKGEGPQNRPNCP